MQDNQTVSRLKERIKHIKDTSAQYRGARDIIRRGGSIEDIIALGIHPAAAKALMNPDSLNGHTQAIANSLGQVKALERQLAREIEKQRRINDKYGR